MTNQSPESLNAQLNFWGPNGEIQFDKDKEALRRYFVDDINQRTVFFHDLEEKLEFLVDSGYYDEAVLDQYTSDFIKEAYKYAYSFKFRFKSFLGAKKFYEQYALRTFDGNKFLERFEDRVTICSLALARGDKELALGLIESIIKGEYQPATPTFLNTGRADAGELISCFLLSTEDNLESLNHTLSSALQLSKRGGGVAINLSNIRSAGDPIKNVEGVSSGVIPYAKMIEDGFRYINQLGQRQGAAAVYIHAHHMDVEALLDTKRENADEYTRLKTLSIGVSIPDVTYELARKGEDMYLFSPYDVERKYGKPFSYIDITAEYRNLVEDPDVRKKRISARGLLQRIVEIRAESGYPYILNIDTVNAANNIAGMVQMSNICSEIVQVQESTIINKDDITEHVGLDVSCNLGSMNVVYAMASGDIEGIVRKAVRSLTAVSELSNLKVVPSIARANRENRSIGLGQMGLAGFFGKEHMMYGDEDSIEFTSAYFSTVAYHAYNASADLAAEIGSFEGFERSKYADGSAFYKYHFTSYLPTRQKVVDIFDKYGIEVPTPDDWFDLSEKIKRQGLANSYLQAVPPTGSISYVQHATASLTPVPALIEIRKEGRVGRVYYPAPEMNDSNKEFFPSAYDVGPNAIIDVYAAATEHVDQGLSMNLFYSSNSGKEMLKSILYAHKKGVKTIYYTRIQQQAIDGTQVEDCVSCTL